MTPSCKCPIEIAVITEANKDQSPYYHRTTNVLTRDENGNAIVAFIKKKKWVSSYIYAFINKLAFDQ